jgi:hypothetical protein
LLLIVFNQFTGAFLRRSFSAFVDGIHVRGVAAAMLFPRLFLIETFFEAFEPRFARRCVRQYQDGCASSSRRCPGRMTLLAGRRFAQAIRGLIWIRRIGSYCATKPSVVFHRPGPIRMTHEFLSLD